MKLPRRIALAIDVALPSRNHTCVFAGIRRHADEVGWRVLIDNWAERALKATRWARKVL
jgi:hypothetical protein